MDVRRFATVMPTFDLREIGSLATDDYRFSTADWQLPRPLKPTDIAVASSASFPLGLAVASVRLIEGDCVVRVVNVLGTAQKPGRVMLVLDLFEQGPERFPQDYRRVILESPFRELDGEDLMAELGHPKTTDELHEKLTWRLMRGPTGQLMEQMTLEQARELVREQLSLWVKAKTTVERESRALMWVGLRECFRLAYGQSAWRHTVLWAVETGELDAYIFDKETLIHG